MDERLGNAPRILHLATGDHAIGARLADFLTECGAKVEPFSDVYRGLARLGKPKPSEPIRGRGNSIVAVLVGVDSLSACEFEFFELCAHRPSPPSVWIYGGPDAQAKIALGLRLGAEFEADVESLQAAFARLGAPHRSSTANHHASPAAGDEAASEAEESSPSPVPWTRGHDGPRRKPPQQAESKLNSESGNEAMDDDDADGPLLTEQELEALIGPRDNEADR